MFFIFGCIFFLALLFSFSCKGRGREENERHLDSPKSRTSYSWKGVSIEDGVAFVPKKSSYGVLTREGISMSVICYGA